MPRSQTVFGLLRVRPRVAEVARALPGCAEWSTLVEETRASAAAGPRARGARALRPVALADVAAPAVERMGTGIGELDRVLGGGLVPGSLVLLGGSPGIGKSTLTGAALGNLAGGGRRSSTSPARSRRRR